MEKHTISRKGFLTRAGGTLLGGLAFLGLASSAVGSSSRSAGLTDEQRNRCQRDPRVKSFRSPQGVDERR